MDKKLRKQERLRREQAAAAADAQRAAEYKQRKALQKQINAYGVKPPAHHTKSKWSPATSPKQTVAALAPFIGSGAFLFPAGPAKLAAPRGPALLGDPGKPLRPFPTAGALARSSPQARLTPPPLPAKAGPWCQTVACKFKGLGGDVGVINHYTRGPCATYERDKQGLRLAARIERSRP